MRKELANLNADDVKGAAALTEITAMARIGGFEIGKSMTGANVRSLKLDAARARRRGKQGRAEELEKRAAHYEKLLTRIEAEQELELARAPVAESDEILLMGRVIDQRRPTEGQRVDLMGSNGKSVANDVTDDLGHFTLRAPTGDSAPSRIVISNGKGALLRSEAAPTLTAGQPAFVEIDLKGAKPKPPTEPPDDDTSENLVEVPEITGLPVNDAAAKLKAAGLDVEVGERPVPGAEPGTVVKQAPAAGARVVKGSKVSLLVASSTGAKVPRLTGRQLRGVPKKLAEDDFKLGKITLAHDPDNAGKVIDQAPKEGATASPGSAVSVRVATGEDKADMQVAVVLIVTDTRGIDLRLTEQKLARALQQGEVTSVAALRQFAKRPATEIAERLGITGRSRAAAAQSLIVDVARRFPDS